MAPNKKKKKIAANPARGFATTSTPSKSKVVEADTIHTSTEEGSATNTPPHASSIHESEVVGQHVATVQDIAIQDMSPDMLEAHLEDAELQMLVDAHATRCKADASRQVSRLETERRQLRSLSYRLATATWLPDEFVDEVLTKYAQTRHHSSDRSSHALIDETSLLLRLWTLKRVLIALKLPVVDMVMQRILSLSIHGKVPAMSDSIWGLQDALEWYAFHGCTTDLPGYENGAVTSTMPATESNELNSSEDQQTFEHTDRSRADNERKTVDHDDREEESVDLTPLPSSGSDDEDPSKFIESYIRLKTLLFDTELKIQNTKSIKLNVRKAKLLSRLNKLDRDPLFDAYAAEAEWRPKLRELQIETAQAETHKSTTRKDWKADKHERLAQEEDIGMLGDMFGEGVSTQEESHTKNVQLVDFGRWSGVQPKKLMEECCRALDSGFKARISTISTTPHSTRQKLDLTWSTDRELNQTATGALPSSVVCTSTSRTISISMQDISTSTPNQAESYLSTLALFLISASNISESKQFNRLPSVWKSLYQDLGYELKQLIDEEDKTTLKEIRSMIHVAIETRKESIALSERASARTKVLSSSRQKQDFIRLSGDEARTTWSARTSTAAYRNMIHARQQLPVHQYQDEILQTVQQNQLVVICADTGAGKSTQIPSFVLEHELKSGHDCRILVTQPRRISAISLARRVSQELGEGRNDIGTERSLVGYAIRLESKTSRTTRITFATTGVLLRMIESAADLDDIEYLILDEVHERTMDLDLLFIALRKLQERRADLKIILMSATIDAEKFSNYFGRAPILNLPGRTFPVEVKYLEDAIEETLKLRDSDNQPERSGDEETSDADRDTSSKASLNDLSGYNNKTRIILSQLDEYRIDYDLVASLAVLIATDQKYIKYSSAILIFMPGIAEIRRTQNALLSKTVFEQGWTIHLLHSSFSTEDLERAFAVPPPGHRKVVIATNIAETGITIPDVTAVIDTCKEKIMRFDERRQLSKLTEGFISRSSARQRRGRAARVQDGLCFHLVTRSRYETMMPEQHVPEMLRLSLQDPILRIKIWNLGSIEETLSAAIDPPSHKNIHRAIERLKDAGALSPSEDLTALGKQLARLPLEVILGKLAVYGIVFKCLNSAITIVAILTSKTPFLSNKTSENEARLPFSRGDSDLISSLNAYQGWRKAKEAGVAHQYCRKHQLIEQNLSAIEDQKIQLLVYLVDADLISLDASEKMTLNKARNARNRKVLFALPSRFDALDSDGILAAVIAMAFYPRVIVREGRGWRNVYSNQHVSLVAGSVNRVTEKPPKWLCFYEAMQSKSGNLNVLETSKIPEAVIVTLMGEAEFRYYSGVMSVDGGKIRFCLKQWKQLAAIKALRECLADVMQRCWQAPGLAVLPSDEAWVDTLAAILVGPRVRTT